ncbi:hypothetical protein CERZMDRAFT_82993 [Cercospora zeae-maydis SCOH1-5]|uniref:Ecp2 effector protein domain-containing protein n=1 Tax=Cercospora zeae-maydis SCOH1-5 TaxID=717836 RepID=A0A6A6FM24_9PEZI|nr:hypothetical protein CERZMDRAFT_82993 [Cercospora zeae-maydis SCOH1-5]
MRFEFTAIFAATGALAAPFVLNTTTESSAALVARGKKLAPDTAKCLGYRNSFWDINQSIFQVTIGRPYLGGSRCGLIEDKVAEFFHVDGLTCKGAKDNKNTIIHIKSNMGDTNLQHINEGLKNAYPEINFDCPDNSLDMHQRAQPHHNSSNPSQAQPPAIKMDHQTATTLLSSVPYIHLFQTTMQLNPKSVLRAKIRVLDKQYDELDALSEAEWNEVRRKELQLLLLKIEAGEWLEEEMEKKSG